MLRILHSNVIRKARPTDGPTTLKIKNISPTEHPFILRHDKFENGVTQNRQSASISQFVCNQSKYFFRFPPLIEENKYIKLISTARHLL